MANTTLTALQNAYETTLVGSVSASATSITVATAPSFSIPAGKKVPIIIDPKNAFMEIAYITARAGAVLTIERGKPMYEGDAGTAYPHSGGAKVIISDPFNIFKDFGDAIDSKLGNDGSNGSTTFDLSLSGSDFRIRKDGDDMKFSDDNQAEVSLSELANASGVNDKAKVSSNDTTTKYIEDMLVAGENITLTVLNEGGNEKIRVTSATAPTLIQEHDVYTPASLTGGTGAESNPFIWDSLTDMSFSIPLDGDTYDITGVDGSSITTMADLATLLQTAVRDASGTEVTFTWDTDHMVITSADTTSVSEVGYLTAVSPSTGTDISGSSYLDCASGGATLTEAVLDVTGNAGDGIALADDGYLNRELLDLVSQGVKTATAGETITVSGNPKAVFRAEGTTTSADAWRTHAQRTGSSGSNVYGANWVAQTFLALTDNIAKVLLNTDRTGTVPGNFNVMIYATSAGVPTGSALGTVTVTGTGVADSDNDHLFTFGTPVAVTKGATYAIVCSLPSGVNTSNCIQVNRTTSGNPYTGGGYHTSSDSGANWSAVANNDLFFEAWGYDDIESGKLYLSDPAHYQRSRFDGFVKETTAEGETATYHTKYCTGFTGLTDKAEYSIDTSGAIQAGVSMGHIGQAVGTTAIEVEQSGDKLIGELSFITRATATLAQVFPYALPSVPPGTKRVELKLTYYEPNRTIVMDARGVGATESIAIDGGGPPYVVLTWTKSTRALVASMSDSSSNGTFLECTIRYYK